MQNKTVTYYVHQLIIDDEAFTLSSFASIPESDTETFDMKSVDGSDGVEILSVKKITKKIYENDRFICLSFDQGDKYPYAPKVVNEKLNEEKNPRKAGQIELDDQFFVLIDVEKQRIWLSTRSKKNSITSWLKEKLKKSITIKSIISDKDFIEKIRSVKEISFTVVPDLFNSANQDTLSHHLVQDILGFGAQKAKLSLEFNNTKISDTIKEKLNKLIGDKHEYQDITVIGRGEEDFESTFNLDEIVSKIFVKVPTNEVHKMMDAEIVFQSLIKKIKEL